MRRPFLAVGLATVACFHATPGGAQEARASADKPWYEQISLNGLVEVSYGYNFNRPDSGLNQYRVFDFRDNTVELEMLELVVQKSVSAPHDAGFRFDLAVGSAVPRVTASSGLFRDSQTGEAGDLDLHQGFVSYVAGVGRGLRIDAGKFVTHFGLEVIHGYDGYNDNATRSFLFGFAIPFTHTGLRVAYPLTQAISGTLMLVNGWDDAVDNNKGKSACLQLAWVPDSRWGLWLNGMGGPERPGNDGDDRFLYEIVGSFKPSPGIALGLDGAYGTEQQALGPGRDASWTAAAGYVRLGVREGFAICLRGEWFDDEDGSRTGTSQRLAEATLTPECKLGRFVVRADLRVDWSDESVFQERSDTASQQPTAFLSVLSTF